jgi:hypothetical protein
LCVTKNKFEYVQKLIRKKININAVDFLGNTSLHYAIIHENLEIIMELSEDDNIVPHIQNNLREILTENIEKQNC